MNSKRISSKIEIGQFFANLNLLRNSFIILIGNFVSISLEVLKDTYSFERYMICAFRYVYFYLERRRFVYKNKTFERMHKFLTMLLTKIVLPL